MVMSVLGFKAEMEDFNCVKTFFTCNACICVCVKLQAWVLRQNVNAFTLDICISIRGWQRKTQIQTLRVNLPLFPLGKVNEPNDHNIT